MLPLLLLGAVAGAAAAEEYTFDSSAFEKKPYELGGYVQLKQEDSGLNRTGAFYKLGNLNKPQRDELGRTTATLELSGKLRQGIGTFDFRAQSYLQRDQLAHDHANTLFEAPSVNSSMSPRTTSRPAMRRCSPSRMTSARGLVRSRRASSTRSVRCSW